MPIQIIESKKLSIDENIWLKNLNHNVQKENMLRIMNESTNYSKEGKLNCDLYLDTIMQVNSLIVKEVFEMNTAEFQHMAFEVADKAGLIAQRKEKVKKEAKEQKDIAYTKKMLVKGFDIDTIMEFVEISRRQVEQIAKEFKIENISKIMLV